MPRYGRSAADAAYEDDAKNFGKLPTPRAPESLLDRLERLRAEPTKGITDPGAGDYSLLLLRMAPDLIAAARALGELTSEVFIYRKDRNGHLYPDWCQLCGGYKGEHGKYCPVPAALASWEKVSRDG